jgi:hypothetical protein
MNGMGWQKQENPNHSENSLMNATHTTKLTADLACPDGRPFVPNRMKAINVQFAPASLMELEIRRLPKKPLQKKPVVPVPPMLILAATTTTP